MFWPTTFAGELSPFERLKELQTEINRVFNDRGSDYGRHPLVNIWGNDDKMVVCAELPGMSLEDIGVQVMGDQLTLEGERKEENPASDHKYYRKERGFGKFIRTFRLPFDIDADKVSASYAGGVLKIELPRAESSRPKSIAVNAG